MNKMKKEFKKLLDINIIKKNTDNINKLKVTLKKNKIKGAGLYASKPIKKGSVIAYYKMKVFEYNKYKSPTGEVYTFDVYKKNGNTDKKLIADLYEGSIDKPFRGKPLWAFFSNEPDAGKPENAHIYEDNKKNFRNRDKLYPGDIVVYKLVAVKNINSGEEVVWCYGDSYVRNYSVPSCE